MVRREETRLEDPLDVRDVAAGLIRRKWLILAIALPVIAAVTAYSYSRTAIYKATAGILVRPALTNLTDIPRPTDISAATETNVATSVAVARVAKLMMSSALTPEQLLQHVSADMAEGTQVLRVSFSDPDPVQAQQGAKAFGDAYLSYRKEQALDLVKQQSDVVLIQLQTVQGQIRTLSTRIQELHPGSSDKQSRLDLLTSRSLALQSQLVSLQSMTANPGEVIDPASVPTSPASPRHPLDIAVGMLLGLGLGVGFALIREQGNDAVRTMVELEEILRSPVLASIPEVRWGKRGRAALVVAEGRRTLAADGYRRLRTGLLGIIAPSETKTVLITSAGSSEGKTATVANLGAGLAEIGKRVVLVSANLRRPALHRPFPTTSPLGLSQVLNDEVSMSDVIQATDIPNLRIIHSGSLSLQHEPANLLQTDRMRDLLAECARNADFVLVDSPGILGVTDTLVLARLVDAVVFVADARMTRWEDVVLARDQLARAGGTVVAGVLNRVEVSRHDRRAFTLDNQMLGLHGRRFRSRARPAAADASEVGRLSVPQPTPQEGYGSQAAHEPTAAKGLGDGQAEGPAKGVGHGPAKSVGNGQAEGPAQAVIGGQTKGTASSGRRRRAREKRRRRR